MQEKNKKQSKKISKTEFSAAIKDFFDEEITTKEEALKFMQEIGVLNKSGKITKNYGGNE